MLLYLSFFTKIEIKTPFFLLALASMMSRKFRKKIQTLGVTLMFSSCTKFYVLIKIFMINMLFCLHCLNGNKL